MTYVKQTWNNGVSGGTPISAARLNYMETGIENAATVTAGETTVTLVTGGAAAAANTAAIVAAHVIAKAAGTTLKFPVGTFYINTGSVIFETNIDATGCTLYSIGTGTAIQLGVASTALFAKKMILPSLRRSEGPIWTDLNSRGIYVVGGLEYCDIFIPYCAWYTYNVDVGPVSDGTVLGIAYNRFFPSHLTESLINWRVKPVGAGAFANDNLVIGGKFSHSGLPTHDSHTAGVREIQIGPLGTGAVDFINGWVFLKTTVETNVAEYMIECYGSDNTFLDCRYESNARAVIGTIVGGSLNTLTIDPLSQVTRWTAFDVGAIIVLPGAGVAGATLQTTIATYVSPTQITLTTPASTTITQVETTIFSRPRVKWGVSGANATAVNNVIAGGVDAYRIVVTTDVGAIRNVIETHGEGTTTNARAFKGGYYGFEGGLTIGKVAGTAYGNPAPLILQENGIISFGSGTAAPDASIYRLGPNALYIDAAITVDGTINSAFDFNIHRIVKSSTVGAVDFLLAAHSGDSQYRFLTNSQGRMLWGSGSAAGDAGLERKAADILGTLTGDKFVAPGGLGVGNSAAATTPGTVTKKIEIFDAAGASLGFIAVYDAIT